MRRTLRGRSAGYGLALGIVGAFVLGAWLHSAVVMLGGPVLVALLILAAAFAAAEQAGAARLLPQLCRGSRPALRG
jgi:hypothetical protein